MAATYTNITGWQSGFDYEINDVIAVTPFGYQVVSLGNKAWVDGSYAQADAGVYKNGTKVDGGNVSYNLTKINVSDGAIATATGNYDVSNGGGSQATLLASTLNGLTSTDFVILWGHDEPFTNRLLSSLPEAVYNVGGSSEKFEDRIYLRGAYILFGRGNIGQDNGLDFVAGVSGNDPNAAIETSLFIPPSGNEINIQKPTEYYVCISGHASSSTNKPPQQSSTFRNGESGSTWTSYWGDMSSFLWTPHYSSSLQTEYNMRSSEGIDTFHQESKPNNINNERQVHTLMFNNIRDRQLQAMITFLRYHHDRSFLYNKQYVIDQNTNKFDVANYKHSWENYDRNNLEIKIESKY